MDSPAFELASELLEALTPMTRYEARGTVRLVLKDRGLDSARVAASEIAVVLRASLPRALQACRIDDVERVCAEIEAELRRRPLPEPEAKAVPR